MSSSCLCHSVRTVTLFGEPQISLKSSHRMKHYLKCMIQLVILNSHENSNKDTQTDTNALLSSCLAIRNPPIPRNRMQTHSPLLPDNVTWADPKPGWGYYH